MNGPPRLGVAAQCFVVPALDGPITGGTTYNRELLAACMATMPVTVLELASPDLEAALRTATVIWVDSLHLAALPELKSRARGRVGLLVHYLPSFVERARVATRSELSAFEREALDCADAFIVPSAFMRDALEALVAPTKKRILLVEPGTHAANAPTAASRATTFEVLMVGNVVPGKGIAPWLRALEAELREGDLLRVSIIGDLEADPEYARICRAFVSASAMLAPRVAFLGPLPHAEVLSRLGRARVFVSASRMESYGLALNEARVLGIPILARAGGNVALHVDPRAGGELVTSDQALARACTRLARDPVLHGTRSEQARSLAPAARSWATAASDFATQFAEWEK